MGDRVLNEEEVLLALMERRKRLEEETGGLEATRRDDDPPPLPGIVDTGIGQHKKTHDESKRISLIWNLMNDENTHVNATLLSV